MANYCKTCGADLPVEPKTLTWKELCEWAYKFSKKITLSGNIEECWIINIYMDENTIFFIEKQGRIKIHKYFYGTTLEIIIAENRTPTQIKSIIENLL